MIRVEINITTGFLLRDQLLMSSKLTIIGSYKRSWNCNIIASIIESFYLNVIDMILPIEKSE
jgi:hypothetical protein